MWCGLGGRQLRRPVRQVVLFNTSMNWSNHRVWCCFRFVLFFFSPLMHGHLNKVVSRLISYMQRKVSPPPRTPLLPHFGVLLAWKSQVQLMLWVKKHQTPAWILILYTLPCGRGALADWIGSDERILAVLRLKWKGFCGRRALRSVIRSTTLSQSFYCRSISRLEVKKKMNK